MKQNQTDAFFHQNESFSVDLQIDDVTHETDKCLENLFVILYPGTNSLAKEYWGIISRTTSTAPK